MGVVVSTGRAGLPEALTSETVVNVPVLENDGTAVKLFEVLSNCML